MFRAEVDPATNLLKVAYAGQVGPEETQRCAEQVRALLPKLRPGFRLLTDLTGLEAMELACLPHIRRIMILLNGNGLETVVRVIPDPHKDIGLNILSLFHYRPEIRIQTFPTLGEAMKVLAM